MANFRTVRGNRGNKATDLDGRDNLYVHCYLCVERATGAAS
jgi:hypothetical protein